MDHRSKTPRNKSNPKFAANFLSQIFFTYLLKLFRKGYKNDLEEADIYDVLPSYKSKTLTDDFERSLNRDSKSIFKLFFKKFGLYYLSLGFVNFLMETIILVGKPFAIGKFLSYFTPGPTALSQRDAWLYGSFLIGLSLVKTIYSNHYNLIVNSLIIKMRAILISVIYRKSLTLKHDNLCVGNIVTLITKDLHSLELFVQEANVIWASVLQILILVVMFYLKIGLTALVVVGYFITLSLFQTYLGTKALDLKKKLLKRTDQRLQSTQEALLLIKLIKMFTWEMIFYDKIDNHRRKEIEFNMKLFMVRFIIVSNAVLVTSIGFFIMLTVYMHFGNILTPEIVYFMYFTFRPISYKLTTTIPFFVHLTSQVVTTARRIRDLFACSSAQKQRDTSTAPRIIYENSKIQLNLSKGLTILTGSTGIGKSHFLKKILGEIDISDDEVLSVSGRLSYASQEPWLFASTIKQNILFGEKFDEKRYRKVIEMCDLDYDFSKLMNGDQTIVEDNGNNLSGGQRDRINLARAVYRNADVYLIDECLSNLDSHVRFGVFQNCFKKFLKDKLVILVTCEKNFFELCDNLIFIEKHGIKFTECFKNKEEDTEDFECTKNIHYSNLKENEAISAETQLLQKSDCGNIYKEIKKSGSVSYKIYKRFIANGGSILFALFVCFISSQYGNFVLAKKTLSQWSNLGSQISGHVQNGTTNSTEFKAASQKYVDIEIEYMIKNSAIVASCVLSFIFLVMFSKKVSYNLHKKAFKAVLCTKSSFFEQTFIGNILNRFSVDLNVVDETFPLIITSVIKILVEVIGTIIISALVDPVFLLPTSALFLALGILRAFYIPTTRSLKRLEASTRSPIVGQVDASTRGLVTIRASDTEKILEEEFDRHQDLYTSTSFIYQCCMNSFSFGLDAFCSVFLSSIIIYFLINKDGVKGSDVGMVLSEAFFITDLLKQGFSLWTDVENYMTSIERIFQYVDLREETTQGMVITKWPTRGEIVFENVNFSYTSGERVLKNLSFSVKPGEKIAITGRTGAGKSSIISILFRLYNYDGRILIDGVDIKNLTLKCLRSNISLVPQESVLFDGSLRDNIDPFGDYLDEDIWEVLRIVGLKRFISGWCLGLENLSNFSGGQKQLICLARASIRKSNILLLDEITSNMDEETENQIVEIILENKLECTVLMITHQERLLKKFDKILVLDDGEIVSYS